jgi:hypothetical protein
MQREFELSIGVRTAAMVVLTLLLLADADEMLNKAT